MEQATVTSPAPTTAATFQTVAVFDDVKITIPARKSKWRVGVWNKRTGQSTPLGFEEQGVMAGLTRAKNDDEDICFTLGLVVKANDGKPVILNRNYHGLSANDFGKNLNCMVEINKKTVGTGATAKQYTSVSITPTPNGGPGKREIKFAPTNLPAGAESYPIEGTDNVISVVSLQ